MQSSLLKFFTCQSEKKRLARDLSDDLPNPKREKCEKRKVANDKLKKFERSPNSPSRRQKCVSTQTSGPLSGPSPADLSMLEKSDVTVTHVVPAKSNDMRLASNSSTLKCHSSVGESPVDHTISKLSGDGAASKHTAIKYTPLEQQFISIKAEYPDAVLFVQCGYKYKFFGEDAEIASKELNIGCFPDHNFVTASIPVHRLYVHLRRLVAAGYKVGVVKQVETAALKASSNKKSGPFTRKLTGLYTKTTLIGPDVQSTEVSTKSISDEDTNSLFLMCVCEDTSTVKTITGPGSTLRKNQAVQVSTGTISYEQFVDKVPAFSELQRRLSHIRPAEVILPTGSSDSFQSLFEEWKSYSNGLRLEQICSDWFEFNDAFSQVSKFYGGQDKMSSSSTSDQSQSAKTLHVIANLPPTVICCLGALIRYLQPFNLQRILNLTSNFESFRSDAHCLKIDRVTLVNLEIVCNSTNHTEKGSLFWVINHTKTSFGRRELLSWLSFPLREIDKIKQRQEAVKELSNPDISLLDGILHQLPDIEKILCSAYHRKCSPSEFYTMVKCLVRICEEVSLHSDLAKEYLKSDLLREFFEDVPCLLQSVCHYLNALCERAARLGDHTNVFANYEQYQEMYAEKKAIVAIGQKLESKKKEYRLLLHELKLDYITVSGLEVKNNKLNAVPLDWTKVNSTKTVTRFRPPAVVEGVRLLAQHREKLQIASKKAWDDFLNKFNEDYRKYKRAVDLLATADCLLSLAKVAQMPGYTCPEVVEDKIISITGGRHAVVDLLLSEGKQYVPNDTYMNVTDSRVVIVTGPNMGGKSCYIKQVALICILAQIGSFVPAHSSKVGLLDAIYTRMGASDKVFERKSTFAREMMETVDIINNASSKSLVILDELGRGTSTHDGTALAYATLIHFIEEVKSFTLFVTHYPLIANLERCYPCAVANYHMSYVEVEAVESKNYQTVVFLYQLEKGKAGGSYGLNVAALAGLNKDILTLAHKKSVQAQNNTVLSDSFKDENLKEFCQVYFN